MRIPPYLSNKKVVETLQQRLTEQDKDTFGAIIEFECIDSGDGFDAPDLPSAMKESLNQANQSVFGIDKQPLYVGCGGSIPFMEVFS